MIRFGKTKKSSKITLDDHKQHLVWTSAHGGRHDEECEKPIISTQEVTAEIISDPLIVPIITVRVDGTEIYGTAWYLHGERKIFAISIWHEGRWRALGDVTGLPTPLVFVSISRILGQDGMRFHCTDPRNENALRIT